MTVFLTTAGNGNPSPWFSIILIGAMLALLYFTMFRPQRKQEKEINEMRSKLSVGDEIVTIGGIVGIIIAINTSSSGEDTITIVTSRDRTRIMLLKSAVSRVQVPANAGNDEKAKDTKEN
ncbi:MAG: preprotein translocase subunit YajC [Clostridia bacterium]|nr:preprotein translocase subunit YajC [Clostridia bacterium]